MLKKSSEKLHFEYSNLHPVIKKHLSRRDFGKQSVMYWTRCFGAQLLCSVCLSERKNPLPMNNSHIIAKPWCVLSWLFIVLMGNSNSPRTDNPHIVTCCHIAPTTVDVAQVISLFLKYWQRISISEPPTLICLFPYSFLRSGFKKQRHVGWPGCLIPIANKSKTPVDIWDWTFSDDGRQVMDTVWYKIEVRRRYQISKLLGEISRILCRGQNLIYLSLLHGSGLCQSFSF